MLISTAYAQAAGGAGSEPNIFVSLLPIILIFAVFYFLLIRPQQKKMKQHREMVSNARRGDRVVTQGGIIGQITKINDEHHATVEIADGVRVKVVKSALADVLVKGDAPGVGDDGGDEDEPEDKPAPAKRYSRAKKTTGGTSRSRTPKSKTVD